MLYCYDYRSYNILVGTDEDTRPQSPQEQFRDEFDDVEEEGPLGSALPAFRQANARQTAQPDRPAPAAVTHQLHMGTRNMAWAWNQVIALLRQRGGFSFQKAVPQVAQRLGVSRYTVYKYLSELDAQRRG
jgi:hypothetical protein